MNYLFIDTSNSLIIGVVKDYKLTYFINEDTKETSGKVMPYLDEALTKSNLDIKDINKIFVVNGPGSFTGIRVGVTIAKIISYCLNIPIIAINELELMASNNNTNSVAIIDARRGFVYGAIYDKDLNIIKEPVHILLTELEKFYPDEYKIIDTIEPDIIRIIKKHEKDEVINPHELKPNYLKLTEAEEKLNDTRS